MVQKIKPGQALELLRQGEEQNRYPVLLLLQDMVSECWLNNSSVCLWDSMFNKYCFSVQSAEDLSTLYDVVKHREGPLVSLLSDINLLDAARALDINMRTRVCVQLSSSPYTGTPPRLDGIRLGGVTGAVAKWMHSVYEHDEFTVDFIMRRVSAAPAVVAYKGDTPVGFFITHSEVEIGPAYVAPALRGSGLAEILYAHIMQDMPKNDLAPVMFVVDDNHISLKWLLRMGCVPAPQKVAWFWREADSN